MGEPQRFVYDDISGGLNEGQPATEIGDRESTVLQNLFPFARKLIRRAGLFLKSSAGAYVEALTGIFNYHPSGQPVTTVVGALTTFARLDGNALVPLTNGDGGTLASDLHPWVMLQYKDSGYAMRTLSGLRRFSDVVHSAAGIVPPVGTPTLADGGAGGVHTIATYLGVVTYLNVASGAESNPSPAGTLALGSNGRFINWSTIPISPSGYVNARRLYRTLPNSAGVYLFVAEIGDNFTTTYVDNVAIADLGPDEVSFDNGVPPVQFIAGDIWNERLFATDGEDVYPSEPFLPESYSGDRIRVFPDDGHKIRAIHADGSRLIIGKTNKIHYLTPAGDDFSLATLSDKHGVYSHHSMKSAEGLLLWYGGDSFYRAFGGGSPESIATVKIKNILARIPDARKEFVVSEIYPRYGWYISSITDPDVVGPDDIPLRDDQNTLVLCYNYKADVWCTFKYHTYAPAALAAEYDSNYGNILLATFYDRNLYELESGLNDAGVTQPIVCKWRTKAYRLGTMGMLAVVRRIFLQMTTVPANATLRLYRDSESATVTKVRTVSLYEPRTLKAYNLSTYGRAGGYWQLEFEYSGDPHIEIESLAIEALSLFRRTKVT